MENSPLSKEFIRKCFQEERISATKHFTDEMELEELGEISTDELIEAALAVEIIREYQEDRPFSSVLALGFTKAKRPIHFCCAWDDIRDLLVLITIYEPKENLWINHRIKKDV